MRIYVDYVFNLSIIIGALIGLIRYKRINPSFYPFLLIMWVGSFNEILSISLAFLGYYNIINFNVYNLVESLLAIWLFNRWHLFEENKWKYSVLLIVFGAAWLIDFIMFSGFSNFNSLYRIFYSFVLILLSINMINRLLFHDRMFLLKNPIFLICSGFIILYTLTVVTEIFFIYGLKLSPTFQQSINNIMTSANLLCNLIYALAILWMPRRQVFSLQY